MRWILILLFPSFTFADCIDRPNAPIEFTVESCRKLDPDHDSEFHDENFAQHLPNYRAFFRGALITAVGGRHYVYPSRKSKVCDAFRPGSKQKKIAGFTCCDTGPIGKCRFGGAFLWDRGAKAVNTFQ